ncbi:uncharacterized protein TNCV_4386731 [Trichonephila clavipes]|nr:uncharacterized protein TNCV_4386731 [Trichonephila clavipes]
MAALQDRSFSALMKMIGFSMKRKMKGLHRPFCMCLHRRYRSERLIDVLYSLGFAASYGKTVQYEIPTAYHSQLRILSSETGALVRYVGDNADINVHTLDDNALHVMGMIKIFTPKDIY